MKTTLLALLAVTGMTLLSGCIVEPLRHDRYREPPRYERGHYDHDWGHDGRGERRDRY